jgi:hypothetical protein
MPAIGAKPKDGPTRHRNPVLEWTEVEDVPFEGPSPDLLPLIDAETGESLWHPQTLAWYEIVRHLPHAVLWREGEWHEIYLCALLLNRLVYGVNGVAAELRLRQKAIGLTADERRDLRIRYVAKKSEPVDEPNVVPIARDRRPRTSALDT